MWIRNTDMKVQESRTGKGISWYLSTLKKTTYLIDIMPVVFLYYSFLPSCLGISAKGRESISSIAAATCGRYLAHWKTFIPLPPPSPPPSSLLLYQRVSQTTIVMVVSTRRTFSGSALGTTVIFLRYKNGCQCPLHSVHKLVDFSILKCEYHRWRCEGMYTPTPLPPSPPTLPEQIRDRINKINMINTPTHGICNPPSHPSCTLVDKKLNK